MHESLVDAAELAGHLDDPRLRILDCRFYLAEPDRGEREYLDAHIPGALYAHLDRDLSAPPTGSNGRHPLPSDETMTARFEAMGIDERVQVIAYDGAAGQIAARLWWMLRYLGHDGVAVLDGGLASWKAAKGALRGGRETTSPRKFLARPRATMRVDVTTLETTLTDHLLVDARARERFRGEVEPLDPVAGHIPGAVNHPTSESLAPDGRFLPAETLRERFAALVGDRPLSTVVSYCGSGVTACHNLLALEVAGLRGARLYPGSWSEWCASPTRPVETGDGGS